MAYCSDLISGILVLLSQLPHNFIHLQYILVTVMEKISNSNVIVSQMAIYIYSLNDCPIYRISING